MGLGIVAAAIIALAGAPGQDAPPEGIVWLALRDINQAGFDEDDPTNRPPLTTQPPAGMIRAVDVSPDGRADWLVDYGAAGLAEFCGTGGCRQRLYISEGDRYVRAFDNQALELTVSAAGGEARIDVWVHHLYCADDNRDCRYAYAWDAGARRLVERSTTSARPMGAEAFVPLRTPEE